MPDPATILVLGLITAYLKEKATGLLKTGADTTLRRLFDHLKSRLEDQTIPANRQLHEAVEASLLDATRAFAYAVAADLGESPPLLTAIRQHWKNGTFSSTPILDMSTVPGTDWVRELLAAADHAHTTPAKGIASHFLLTADALPALITHTDTHTTHTTTPLQQQVDSAFTTWLARHVHHAKPPPCVAGFLTHGWPLHKDSPQRIRFYEAFIRFFHHRIATIPVVKDILLVQTTAHTSQDVKTLLKQLRLSDTTLRKWLDSQALSLREIQEHTRLLPSIQKDVKAIRRTTRHIKKAVTDNALRLDVLAHYKEELRDSYSIYDELGSPITSGSDSDAKPVTIGNIFVPPSCAHSHYAAPEFDAALQSGNTLGQPLLPYLNDLFSRNEARQRRVVLIGDPGMGKSTLIKWLIVSPLLKVKARPAALPPSLRDAIPLPFIIRDLVRHLPDDVAQWDWPALTQAFREFRAIRHATKPLLHAFDGDDAAFESLLLDPRALYLVDGLDEISDPKKRTAIRDALWQGFDATPHARWLLTSRWIGYDAAPVDYRTYSYPLSGTSEENQNLLQNIHHMPDMRLSAPLSESDIEHLTRVASTVEGQDLFAHRCFITPFTDRQQDDYARNWFTARRGPSVGADRSISLMQEIRRSENLRILSRVPNLLCLMAQLKLRDVPLPDGRAELYDAITTAYLKTIDEVYALNAKHGHHPPCDIKDAICWLSIIAMHLQVRRTQATREDTDSIDPSPSEENSEILATHADLEEWLRPEIARTHPGQEAATLRDFLRHISQRTAFLQERGEGQHGFIHLSFQEYYAARWLEREFRRQNQTHTAADDWLAADPATAATPAPAPPLEVTSEMWPQFADTPAWQEPLIFLAEKLTDENDVKTLRTWLFHSAPNHLPPLPLQAARLLATLSVDKQVNLPFQTRITVWTKLWEVWAQMQPSEADASQGHPWQIASVLLAPHAYQSEAQRILRPLITQSTLLCLDGCASLSNASSVANLTHLTYLDLSNCTAFSDASALAHLSNLTYLDLSNCTAFSDASPLASLTNLKLLHLNARAVLDDNFPAARLTNLTHLHLTECGCLSDVSAFVNLTKLTHLHLNQCTSLGNFSLLTAFTNLTYIGLTGCASLKEASPLSQLTALKQINLNRSTALMDVSPLAELSDLTHLFLNNCTALSDTSPLASLSSLQYLDLTGCTALDPEAIRSLRQALPQCHVVADTPDP